MANKLRDGIHFLQHALGLPHYYELLNSYNEKRELAERIRNLKNQNEQDRIL